jgi:choline dehydrogenase-like flavoprotein
VLVESIKYIRKLASTAPFSDVIQTFNDPPASSQSDDDFAGYARDALQSLKHPIGTAALGPRALGGVVDQNYLVYGTKNLRVVDASIFPMQISAHPQTTVYAIAEKVCILTLVFRVRRTDIPSTRLRISLRVFGKRTSIHSL